ncbi:MAG: aldose 1-epimerase [Thermoproteus sp.]
MITLRAGSSEAVLYPRGAYLSALRRYGVDVILPGSPERQTRGGMAILMPFANRVRGGIYEIDGATYSLPKNAEGHAIHGLVMNREWALAYLSDRSAVFALELSHEGYPSRLLCKVSYRLSDGLLEVFLEATNLGPRRAPLVAGAHPYFVVEEPWAIRAKRPMRCVAVGKIPTGEFAPHEFGVGGNYDDCFLVAEDPVVLESPHSVIKLERRDMPYIQVYTGVVGAVALEPMSGAPDAYHNGLGLKILAPGETARFWFSMSFQLGRGPLRRSP